MIELKNGDNHLVINEDCGLTVQSWRHRDIERLVFDEARIKARRTSGIPVLFPTPNRVKDNHFLFEGNHYPGIMHGQARFERFEITERSPNSCTGVLRNSVGSEMHKSFPFLFELIVEIVLGESGITWNFAIENRDTKNLPFGIAIHPYIKKQGLTKIVCTAEYAMHNDENQLPDGNLEPSVLASVTNVDALNLDTVFYSDKESVTTKLYTGKEIYTFSGTDEFHHTVIYTPKGESFVCIEPQSCSTDCMNLFTKGFEKISGLQVLAPQERIEESVSIKIL